MSLNNLDLTDRKILAELDKNARVSYSALGKRIHVAKETVKYRIQQLETRGVIRGYYTIVNFSKLGFLLYRLYLRLQNTSPAIEQEITAHLLHSKQVSVFYRTTGPYHLALALWARNLWECERFWLELKTRFGGYIASSHLSLLTEYNEFSRPYLLPGRPKEKIVFRALFNTPSENPDALDLKLLAFLSNNARATLVEITSALSVSLVTARYRLKSLVDKKIIVGFRSILHLPALGREYYKVDLWFRKFDRVQEVTQHIFSHPAVAYNERTLLAGDLEFDLEVESFEQFIAVMDSFKAKFPEEIRDYSYYSQVKNYKTSYVPTL